MKPKATMKRIAAMRAVAGLTPGQLSQAKAAMMSSPALYEALEVLGLRWDGKTWRAAQEIYGKRISTRSEFVYDDGEPSPIVKIRIMAHPILMDVLLAELSSAQGLQIISTSHEQPNRAGAGARVYVAARLASWAMPAAQKGKRS